MKVDPAGRYVPCDVLGVDGEYTWLRRMAGRWAADGEIAGAVVMVVSRLSRYVRGRRGGTAAFGPRIAREARFGDN